jgi:acetoacetyl-CoA reductase
MQGRNAILTGASHGIGPYIARALVARGMNLLVVARTEPELHLLARQLRTRDINVAVAAIDLADPRAARDVAAAAAVELGTVDVLVNNAAVELQRRFHTLDTDEIEQVIRVDLTTPIALTRLVLPAMLERGYGRIINISSVIGEAGGFGQANYAAAKSGMFGLTMSLALETASKGITVNSVTPGFITTDMTAAVPAAAMEKIVARIPVGRLGEPNEVARVVEFLADPESGYITGQVYAVNGGLYM